MMNLNQYFYIKKITMLIKSILEGYPQTWADVSRMRKIPYVGEYLYKFTQWLCGKITGHRNSKTEWGYGGGEYANVWCRWCNKIGQMPVKDIDNLRKGIRTIIWQQTGCDIKKDEWKIEKK